MNRRSLGLGVGLAISLIGTALVVYRWVIPFREAGRQVTTYANMTSLRTFLDIYHEKHGTYPSQLREALDEVGLRPGERLLFLSAVWMPGVSHFIMNADRRTTFL
jgi:hypothetical protein